MRIASIRVASIMIASTTITPLSLSWSSPARFVSTASIKGKRDYMEDEFIALNPNLYAVFDGHGGSAVSIFLRESFAKHFMNKLSTKQNVEDSDVANALEYGLNECDKAVMTKIMWNHIGSTACVLYVNDNSHGKSLLTANVGDSRAVLGRNRLAVDLTVDHKPEMPSETKRIKSVGGRIIWDGYVTRSGVPIQNMGVYRVNGVLSLSRAIGDVHQRPAMSPIPDINILSSSEQDDFVIVATDGLWEVFTSQEAVDTVYSFLDQYSKPPNEIAYNKLSEEQKAYLESERCKQLVTIKQDMAMCLTKSALIKGSNDNISVLVVWLK